MDYRTIKCRHSDVLAPISEAVTEPEITAAVFLPTNQVELAVVIEHVSQCIPLAALAASEVN